MQVELEVPGFNGSDFVKWASLSENLSVSVSFACEDMLPANENCERALFYINKSVNASLFVEASEDSAMSIVTINYSGVQIDEKTTTIIIVCVLVGAVLIITIVIVANVVKIMNRRNKKIQELKAQKDKILEGKVDKKAVVKQVVLPGQDVLE